MGKLHGVEGLLSRNLVGRQKGFDGEFRLKVLQYKQEPLILYTDSYALLPRCCNRMPVGEKIPPLGRKRASVWIRAGNIKMPGIQKGCWKKAFDRVCPEKGTVWTMRLWKTVSAC